MSFVSSLPQQEQIYHVNIEEIRELPGSDDQVIRVYFIRHGESESNVLKDGVKYVQGKSPQVPLTEKGRAQAERLADQIGSRIEKLKPLIVTSTAKRAIDTALPLLKMVKMDPVGHYEEFLELGSGKWEGVSKDDPAYLEDYQKWKDLSAKEKFHAPKVSTGESPAQVADRALKGLNAVLEKAKSNETIFVFGHQMLMNAVAISLSKAELGEESASPLPDFQIGNGDIMMIEIPGGAPPDEGQVKVILDTLLHTSRP